MTQLSTHFSYEEMTHTSHPIPNVPDAVQLARLTHTAEGMEKVKTILNSQPILVQSGFRCPAVNEAVGGSKTSDHMNGDACDFVCPAFGSTFDVAEAIRQSGLKFDQLILEYGWVHVSWGPRMRQQCLTKRSAADPYESGINK